MRIQMTHLQMHCSRQVRSSNRPTWRTYFRRHIHSSTARECHKQLMWYEIPDESRRIWYVFRRFVCRARVACDKFNSVVGKQMFCSKHLSFSESNSLLATTKPVLIYLCLGSALNHLFRSNSLNLSKHTCPWLVSADNNTSGLAVLRFADAHADNALSYVIVCMQDTVHLTVKTAVQFDKLNWWHY